MSSPRLSAAGRRASIIAAARQVFARHGLEGARTQQIARAAGVSEALVFRHFPSKIHIYRAVLREVIADQNATFRATSSTEASTKGLLTMLAEVIDHALGGSRAHNAEGMRMVVGSLAGDGNYARLVYRRALRISHPALERALEGAGRDGGISGKALQTADAAAFIEHVSTMMMMARCHERIAIPYHDDARVVRDDAILFCARGLGIAENHILAFLAEHPPREHEATAPESTNEDELTSPVA